MDDLRHWSEILLESYTRLIDGVIYALPRIFGGIILFLLGWLLARVLSSLITKSLKALRFDKMMDRVQVGEFLRRIKVESMPSQIVGKFIYWIMMLLLLVGFSEALNLTVVSQKIGVLINYIPNIFIAAIILILGLYLANKLKEFVQLTLSAYATKASKLIGNILFYIVALFVVLTALEQLQFNIDLLTSNVMILLGGVALAFAIGYGLAAKEIFPHIISAYYSKNMFQIGNQIRVGQTEGKIIEMTNLSVVVETSEGKRYIPAKKLVTEEVEVMQ